MPAGYVSDSDDEADQLENASDDDSEIPGAVQSANYRVYSTWELYERMVKKTIDVAPPYQRDVVWTKNSQSALIDSIFKNKWVPTLLFSERPATLAPDGTKIKARWVCMDGKQRLTSIRLFIDGEIPWFKKPKEPIYYKQSHPPHPSRRLLDEALKDIFLSRGLTAAMYSQLTELQERDIFRLVQEGKPLSTGEKLQASAGSWGSYIGELTEHYMVKSPKNLNGWSQRISNLKRGADYHTMAEVVLMIREIPIRAPEPPRSLTTAAIQKELDRLSTTPVSQEVKEQVRNILDIFMEVSTLAPPRTQYTVELRTPEALHQPIQKGRKTMLAPVEMIWIPYMIHLYYSQLSKGKLLEMIEMFKLDIRRRWFNEVKKNNQVIPWIVHWIATFNLGRLQGKYVGWAVPRPAPQLLSPDNPAPDVSGMHQFANRSSGVQPSVKREAPSAAESLTDLANAHLKKPRHSVQATNDSHGKYNSPNIPSSQHKLLPKVSSSLSRSVATQPVKMIASATISNSQSGPSTLAPQRINHSMNGSQLFSRSPNNARQPSLSLPASSNLRTHNPKNVCVVPTSQSRSIRPVAGIQRSAPHLNPYSSSAAQPMNNARVSQHVNDHVFRQQSGYTFYHQST